MTDEYLTDVETFAAELTEAGLLDAVRQLREAPNTRLGRTRVEFTQYRDDQDRFLVDWMAALTRNTVNFTTAYGGTINLRPEDTVRLVFDRDNFDWFPVPTEPINEQGDFYED